MFENVTHSASAEHRDYLPALRAALLERLAPEDVEAAAGSAEILSHEMRTTETRMHLKSIAVKESNR